MNSFYRLLLTALLSLSSSFTSASINDYIYKYSDIPSYSNYGSLGLIQMPNARFYEAGSLAFSFSNNDPYINASVLAYPFDWMEASYQYTDINNALYSDNTAFSGDQTYKDKGFDVKFRLLKESQYFPQVAIGARDIAGTSVFTAEYLVFSKFINNIDFTLGIGWGTLSRDDLKNPLSVISDNFNERIEISSGTLGGEIAFGKLFSGPAGIFGGLEWTIPNFNGLRFKLEYDATDYSKEGFPLGRESFQFAFEPVEPSESKFNFGFVYPISKNFQLKLSQTKGNNLNFGFSFNASWGQENAVQKVDPIKSIENSEDLKTINQQQKILLYRSVMKNLRDNDFFLQSADLTKETLSVNFTQSKHISHTRAFGRVARIIDKVAPDNINKFNIINSNADYPVYSATINRNSFNRYEKENLYKLASRDIVLQETDHKREDHDYKPRVEFPLNFWTVAPVIRSQIGGPDGFFFGDIRLNASSEILFSRKMNLTTSASVGLVSNLDEISLASDSIIEHVRTDIVKYLQETEKFGLQRMQFNYFRPLSSNVYAKFSAGLFEEMFGGYGGEVLYRPFDKNYGIGAEIWHVKQRAYDMLFDFRDYETVTGHITTYYRHPKSQVLIALKGGRFLAGDSGINFDFSRRFKTGLRIGAFFSKTDISRAEFGEGSFDKGFYFTIPVETFFSSHLKRHIGWGLRPLTRDGASYLNHSYYLWGVTEAAAKNSLTRDWDDLYE
ncbi:YjbH domain-containing protein [Gammaproteobacteria bacterium]|nr:YjbH domain-containing protein [Gammaproteobacteria bacterium]